MEEGQLPKESCIRADKIYTLNQSIIVKKYGRLKQEKLDLAFNNLVKLIK
jgi:mRNA interferase MazF